MTLTLVLRAVAAAAMFFALLGAAAPQVVECVAAHVNRRAITLTDIRVLQALHLGEDASAGAAASSPAQVLQRAIDRQVVVDVMREDFPVPREEVGARLASLKARYEPDEWRRVLETFGITEDGVESYLENILQYERMVAIHFGQPPLVTVQEMQDYYNREYAPAKRSAGIEPEAMSQVMGEIEGRLRDRKRQVQISDWIRSLRAQAEISVHEECLQNLK